jgi:hypothetical protein
MLLSDTMTICHVHRFIDDLPSVAAPLSFRVSRAPTPRMKCPTPPPAQPNSYNSCLAHVGRMCGRDFGAGWPGPLGLGLGRCSHGAVITRGFRRDEAGQSPPPDAQSGRPLSVTRSRTVWGSDIEAPESRHAGMVGCHCRRAQPRS